MKYPRRLAIVWSRRLSHKPLVDNTALWLNSSAERVNGIRFAKLRRFARSGVVRIIGTFTALRVGQAHGVHRGVVLCQVVDEHDLNHVTDFSADGRA